MYAAKHRITQVPVALKIIFLGKPGLSEEAVAVLRREFALMSRISHPNIANIYDKAQPAKSRADARPVWCSSGDRHRHLQCTAHGASRRGSCAALHVGG